MSQAHRPTWNPTQGRETKAGSQQISKLSLASYTKLKFRRPGQTNTSDVARRDLRAELIAAERAASDKKRKAAGLPALDYPSADAATLRIEGVSGAGEMEGGDDEAKKRRRVLEAAAELDKDDSDDENEGTNGLDKGKGKAVDQDADDDDDDDSDDDE